MKKTYDTLFFDLDGTITDSAEGIINSVIYAMKKIGVKETDRQKLVAFIGPPLVESFHSVYGIPKEECGHMVKLYREYYEEKGIYENRVYDGIPEVLKTLNEAGKTVAMATSKPTKFAVQILDHFHILNYFSYISGAKAGGEEGTKNEVIIKALEMGKIQDRSRVLMVGDRDLDILGANKAGIDSLAVLYGFGSRQEIDEANPTYVAETVHDILNYV